MNLTSTGERGIRWYRHSDKARVLEIIGKVWGEDTRRDHEILWDWKHAYMEQEFGGYHSRVLEQGGVVAGYTGISPVRVKIVGRRIPGGCGRDTFVAPENRGAGIRLMKRQLEESGFLFGAANDRTSELWIRISKLDLSRTRICSVKKMVHLIDPTEALARRGVPRLLGRLGKLALRGARDLDRLIRGTDRQGLWLQTVNEFPPEVDALCEEFAGRFNNIVLRDRHYLNWRFVECPVQYCKQLLWSGDKLCGYMVYRPGQIHGRKVLLMVEMVAVEDCRKNYGIMVEELLRIAAREQVCDIQALRSGCPDLDRTLAVHLFLEKREKTIVMGWINDCLGLTSEEVQTVHCEEQWFLSMGDGDFEFIFFDQKPSHYIDRKAEQK